MHLFVIQHTKQNKLHMLKHFTYVGFRNITSAFFSRGTSSTALRCDTLKNDHVKKVTFIDFISFTTWIDSISMPT